MTGKGSSGYYVGGLQGASTHPEPTLPSRARRSLLKLDSKSSVVPTMASKEADSSACYSRPDSQPSAVCSHRTDTALLGLTSPHPHLMVGVPGTPFHTSLIS